MKQADVILVGGGLANMLIALRLTALKPQLNVLIVERGPQPGGNHTWSFHGSDLSPAQWSWIEPLVEYSWQSYSVRFPGLQRTLPGSYHSITSGHLRNILFDRLGGAEPGGRVRTNCTVAQLYPDYVILADGGRLSARVVIDGRGPAPSPHLDVRFQKFVGRVIELDEPHGLTGPIIMDATHAQDDGYRFFYTLPFDARTLLIEDTRYSDTSDISSRDYGDAIDKYAANQGWSVARLLREEDGVLPITLGGDIKAFWSNAAPVARAGLKAALFHPATGYSLPNAARLADLLAMQTDWTAEHIYACTRDVSERLWRVTGYYRALNRMLFLAADVHDRRRVLQRFYGLNARLIARFYAGESTWADKARILVGRPPVRLTRAYQAVFRYPPSVSAG